MEDLQCILCVIPLPILENYWTWEELHWTTTRHHWWRAQIGSWAHYWKAILWPKEEKQYRIHWKGYFAMHDTWEPAANVHASELVKQFLHQPLASIREVQLEPEDVRMHLSSFWEGLFETPGRRFLITFFSQPVSPATTVHFAEALAQTYSDRVISETICVLETRPIKLTPSRAAHHEETKQQKRPKG